MNIIGKIGSILRYFFDGLLITLGILLISEDKRSGGTEVNGYIALLIWVVMIGIMYKVSNLLGVAGTYMIYILLYIVKYGISQNMLYLIITLIAIGIIVYKLYMSQ